MKKSRLLKVAGFAATQIKNDEKIHHKFFAFFRMGKAFLTRRYNLSFLNILMGSLIMLYLLSPLDFIPELALGPFGLIDDFGIFIFGFKFFDKEIIKFMAWEKQSKELI